MGHQYRDMRFSYRTIPTGQRGAAQPRKRQRGAEAGGDQPEGARPDLGDGRQEDEGGERDGDRTLPGKGVRVPGAARNQHASVSPAEGEGV